MGPIRKIYTPAGGTEVTNVSFNNKLFELFKGKKFFYAYVNLNLMLTEADYENTLFA
jgi:hypothetical protein